MNYNMAYHFCTIVSTKFLPFTRTLFHSLIEHDDNVHLHVLVIDKDNSNFKTPNLHFYSIEELINTDLVSRITHLYQKNNNYLRWALKPVFISHLLKEYDKIIYVDSDIYFYEPFDFLFKELNDHSILLTPHWLSETPFPYSENFESNFTMGQFNAGFIGASRNGLSFLNWWAEVCCYRMERNAKEGFYDDQRYLDMAPVIEKGLNILQHRGCNLGSWNLIQNKRSLVNGKVLINKEYPIIFIHFNHETIRHILNMNDPLLFPHLHEYEENFKRINGHTIDYLIPSFEEWKKSTIIDNLKRKTKIRTKIKNWLFQLSKKL